MYKTVPFQIFNGNAKNNSFQLVLTAFHSSFFSKIAGFFFQGARGAIIGFNARAFQTELRNAKLARGCQNYRKLCFEFS